MRVTAGLTQSQLCEASGVSRPALSRAENGQPVDEKTLRRLAQALGVDVRDYFAPPAYAGAGAPVAGEVQR